MQVDLLTALSEAIARSSQAGALEVLGESCQSLPPDPARDVERLVPRLIECMDDAHTKVGGWVWVWHGYGAGEHWHAFRRLLRSARGTPSRSFLRGVANTSRVLWSLCEPQVAAAALGVLGDAVAACPHALEHSLDRFLPGAFARQQDAQKDAVRGAAARLLQG